MLEQTHGLRLYDRFRLDRFILSPSGRWREIPNFTILSSLAFCDVASVGIDLRKLITGAQLQTFPRTLSNSITIVSLLQRLLCEIVCTNSDVQNRDRQTDKKLMVFGRPGGG